MKRFFCILYIYMLIVGSLSAQSINLKADLSYARFYSNKNNILELYLTIDASTVNFVKNSENQYQSKVYCEIEVKDSLAQTILFDKFNLASPTFDSLRNFLSFGVQKRYSDLPSNISIQLKLDDINTPDSSIKTGFPVSFNFDSLKIAFSDIQLLQLYELSDESNEYVKNGYKMVTYNSDFYPRNIDKLKFYYEIYNLTEKIPENEEFVFHTYIRDDETNKPLDNMGKYHKSVSKNAIGKIGEIQIRDLPSGNYELVVEVRNRENKLIKGQIKSFVRSNPGVDDSFIPDAGTSFASNMDLGEIKHYVSSFRPLADEREKNTINAIEKTNDTLLARNFIYSFCYKRNKYNVDYYWAQLKQDIDYVDQKYGTSKSRGYLCQLGRVYLQYGKPNRIETEFDDPQRNATRTSYPYQIWYYYKVKNQMNRVFVFVNRSIGSNCYDLIHSDVLGETNIPDWNNHRDWKKLLQQYNQANQKIDYSREDYFGR